MDKIHLSELYSVSEVKLGSELYYICELGKYLNVCGYVLSLDGVILDRVLRNSRFWDYLRVANYNGWVCDLTCSDAELLITPQSPVCLKTVVNRLYSEVDVTESAEVLNKRRDDVLFDLATPKPFKICFAEKTSEEWVWTKGKNLDEELLHTRSLGGTNYVSQCFVSLVAYVAIKRFMTNSFDKFRLVLDISFLTNEHAVSDLILLEERTNALDWFVSEYNVSEDRANNLGYEAWLYRGREMGYEQREYSAKEKMNNFKRLGFNVGDIVGLYERKVSQKGNMVKSLCDFHFAIIRGANAKGLTLEVVQSRKTRYGYQKEFDELSTAVKSMFQGKSRHSKFHSVERFVEWNALGVEYMMDAEKEFITPLQGDDIIDLLVSNGEREAIVRLNEFDFIYWLLKDYNVSFAEEKFLKRYFNNAVPAYNKYMNVPV